MYRSDIRSHEDEDVKISSAALGQDECLLNQVIASHEQRQANAHDDGNVCGNVEDLGPSLGQHGPQRPRNDGDKHTILV